MKLLFFVPFSTCDPQRRASFDPRGIIWTNLVEVHKEMLYTKYESPKPSSFIQMYSANAFNFDQSKISVC